MSQGCILITGANGEIGHGLVSYLSAEGQYAIVAIDKSPQVDKIKNLTFHQGDITDAKFINDLGKKYKFDTIFHLAGILSTGGERDPKLAHQVNVEGSLNLLNMADAQSASTGFPTKFIFPSTIAVYGFSNADERMQAGKIKEHQALTPTTMYGCNKLYVENLGRYYSEYYKRFEAGACRLDFRCVRLPGVLSADTVPTGGTSDYGPEMVHAAAQGKAYECFVTPDAKLPFMVMADTVTGLINLSRANRKVLTQAVYNITSFCVSAEEIRSEVLKYFPKAQITFKPNPQRLAIVNSWPLDIDDSAARRDWGWCPKYDAKNAFGSYMIPSITKRYAKINNRSTETVAFL